MRSVVASALVCLALSPAPVAAQPLATLRVTVTDPSGAVIVGARIEIVAPGSPVQGAESGGRGEAIFERLAPGRYALHVQSPGFEDVEVRDIRVRPGENRREVRLALAKIAETVRVGRDAQTQGADPRGDAFATILGQRQIDDLPDDPDEMERALTDMAGPGAVIRVNGFRGGRLPPKDQIQQIRFRRNMFAADSHEAGAVAVDIITRPGLETWRGSFAGAGRGSALSARNAFAPLKPDEAYGRFTLSLTGPLWRNHTSIGISADGVQASDAKTIVAALPAGLLAGTERRPTTARNVSIRVEHAFAPGRLVRAEFQHHALDQDNLGVGDFDLPERAYRQASNDEVVRLSSSTSIGSSTFNELRVQIRRGEIDYAPAYREPAVLVLNAFNSGGAQIEGMRRTAFAEVADDVDIAIENHALRVGVLVERERVDSDVSRNAGGTFTFAGLGAFAAGTPTTFTLATGDPALSIAPLQLGAYLQDDFRARKNLTISGGVRVERQSQIGGLHIGPRGGVAWSPFRSGTTTIRAGGGMFFDWLDAATYEQVLQLDGSHRALETIVNPGYPDPRSRRTAVVLPLGQSRLASALEQPKLTEASFGVERAIGRSLRVNAVATRRDGSHRLRSINVNAPVGGVRPDPPHGPINEVESNAHSSYTALSVNATYTPPRRIFAAATYTLAESIDEADSALALPADNRALAGERGPALNDARHRLTGLFSVPIAGHLRAGISARLQSALPYNVTTGRDDNGDTISVDRPIGVTRNSARGRGQADISVRIAWAKGFGDRASGGGAAGPQSRTRGDDSNPLAGLGGGVDLTKRYTVELYAQAFNALNRTNVLAFSGVTTSPFFGQPTSAAPPRRIELGARLAF